ncbi:uncharacterized protein gpsm1a isoform 2-T2 [Spinachia spinachia]
MPAEILAPPTAAPWLTRCSWGSALSSRTRTKRSSSKLEEPEAMLELILESQGKRLEDQRGSFNLYHEPGSAYLCEACNPPTSPSVNFYYMLIHYQSHRMEDQGCSLPDLDEAAVEGIQKWD